MNKEITTKINCIESACGRHRYYLAKRWSSVGTFGLFVCQNPSTANELTIDPTYMNCNNLAVYWGWSGFAIVNLFSVRAPILDNSVPKPWNTPESGTYMANAFSETDIIVVAAGAKFANSNEYEKVIKEAKQTKGTVFCIKNNKDGGALHPSRPITVSDYIVPQKLVE